MATFQALIFYIYLFSIQYIAHSAYKTISEECPNPSERNDYDPRMAFNKYLDPAVTYPLHSRSAAIVANIMDNLKYKKLGWSRRVPVYVVDRPTTTWETYDVIWKTYSDNNGDSSYVQAWKQFKVPPANLTDPTVIQIGRWMWDGLHDYPFVIKDPNSIYGEFIELRGFHTYIDHAAKKFYCEGCGLFRYNNDGATYDNELSFGQPKEGAGTGSGLSWAGVVRKHDVLSGHIAHAIRATFSGCDFMGEADNTHYVAPAIKTDQPKSCSPDTVPDDVSVEMGYRFRLSPSVICDNRLAPMIENNGNWFPPTIQQTNFVRMFCRAIRDYGLILSDGAGYRTFALQGEADYPGSWWKDVFGSEIDDSTDSWTYLIRDQRSSVYGDEFTYDNRYRDERYGLPWDQLQLLADSTVGVVNNCCLDINQCVSPTAAPTYAPYVDDDTNPSAPKCTNENCCFKYRTIKHELRVSDDDCVIYNNTFIGVHQNNLIEITKKRDGSNSKNTLIEKNRFFPTDSQDAVDINWGEDTLIKDNIFNPNPTSTYAAISLHKSLRTTIQNNEFKGEGTHKAINFQNSSEPYDASLNVNTVISGNTFTNLRNGIYIAAGTDITITNNIFENSSGNDGIYWNNPVGSEYSSIDVYITSNTFINLKRSVYVFKSGGTFLMSDNDIIDMSDNGAADNGIEFAGYTDGAVVSNNRISNVKYGILIHDENRNIEINGNTIHTADVGLYMYGFNFNIIGNTIYDIHNDRGMYLRSCGTVNGNLMYNVIGSNKDRGISTSADDVECATHSLIIENNIIFDAGQDAIYLYKGPETFQRIIVRFNTLINKQSGSKTLAIDSGFADVDVYCNILIDTTGNYHNTPSNTYTYQNYKDTATSNVLFTSVDFNNLGSQSDFSLQATSPAIGYCNSLTTATYPLSTPDITGIKIRSTSFDIDVGAYQQSPINTLSPTLTTISPTITPTSITNSPTSSTTTPTTTPTKTPTAITNSPTGPTSTPTSDTIQPTYSPTTITSAPATTTQHPTTTSPTSVPTSNTDAPTSTTTSPTTTPTSITVSPTSQTEAPTSQTLAPTVSTISPTSSPNSVTGEPNCLNPTCCHKNEEIDCAANDNPCIIEVDNCVFWKCIILPSTSSDVMKIITNPITNNPSEGTIISDCTFRTTSGRDMIDIKDGKNTNIINNIFEPQTAGNYKFIRLSKSMDTTIDNNEFTGNGAASAISFEGNVLTDNENINIRDNTFDNVDNAVFFYMATNVFIEDNTFKNNIGNDPIRWYYGSTPATADTVYIRRNNFTDCKRAIYVYSHSNALEIDSNIISTTSSHGIEFAGASIGVVVTNNQISDINGYGIVASLENRNMQINGNTIHTANVGIYTLGYNFNIVGNKIYDINSDRGVYVRSYGTINGNWIYNVDGSSKDRGISTSADNTECNTNSLIIENNIIFNANQDTIYLYKGPESYQRVIIRFNTLINQQNSYQTLNIDAGLPNVDVYCNIFVDTSENYHNTPSNAYFYNNIQQASTDYFQFVSVNMNSLGANSDFSLQAISPAIAYCNGLDSTTYPLSTTDITGITTRSTSFDIDVGAYQESPINTVSPTTGTPTAGTSSPTSDSSSPTTITTAPTSITLSPTSSSDAPTAMTTSPTSDTTQPTYSPTITTSAPATTSDAPTANTPLPTSNSDAPTANTPSPTSDTISPTTITSGPTSVTGSPTTNSVAPTSTPINTVPAPSPGINGCNCYDYIVTETLIVNANNCVIDKCIFEFSDEGIDIEGGVSNIIIRNNIFKIGTNKDTIRIVGDVTNLQIDNNEFNHCRGKLIDLTGGDLLGPNNKITNNHFNGSSATSWYHAIELGYGSSNGLEISNNLFENIKKNAIEEDGNSHSNLKILNNRFENCGLADNIIEIGGSGFEISNNILYGSDSSGIIVESYGTIANNKIYDVDEYGIFYKYLTQNGDASIPIIIENNMIYKTGWHNIRVQASSNSNNIPNAYIRFNTMISESSGKYVVDVSSSFYNHAYVGIYCNIAIRSDGGTIFDEDGNNDKVRTVNNIETDSANNIAFINYPNSNGNDVDLHLSMSSTSSAQGYCYSSVNTIDTNIYPMINYDIDWQTRSNIYDAGADQKTGITLSPTAVPTAVTPSPVVPASINSNNKSDKNDNSTIYYIVIIFCVLLLICAIIIIYYQCYVVKKLKRNENNENNNNNNNKSEYKSANKWVDAATPIDIINGPITPITPLTMAKQIELQKVNENNSSFGAAVKRIYNNQFSTHTKQLETDGYRITSKHNIVPSSSVFNDDEQPKINKNIPIIPPKIKVVTKSDNNNIHAQNTPTTPLKVSDQMEEQMDLTPIIDESQTFID